MADLTFPKEFPSNLGHAVGLVTSRTGQQNLELRVALGWDKFDWFCQQVRVNMVSWFLKGECL